jgi:Tfp pilus assembly protein PilV
MGAPRASSQLCRQRGLAVIELMLAVVTVLLLLMAGLLLVRPSERQAQTAQVMSDLNALLAAARNAEYRLEPTPVGTETTAAVTVYATNVPPEVCATLALNGVRDLYQARTRATGSLTWTVVKTGRGVQPAPGAHGCAAARNDVGITEF